MAKRKKKKKVLKIKNILLLLLLVLILLLVIFYVLKMPIKNIYISGNIILSDNVIIEEAQLSDYPSFFLTTTSFIKKNLKKNSYIANVKIHKKIGNVVEISIEEYKVLASLCEETQLILSNGDIVDNVYNVIDAPILINSIEDSKFRDFVDKFSKIDDDILRQISQIEYSKTDVDDSRFLLYMNDGNLVYITLTKINKLNKYNDIKDKMENQTGIIYLDSGNYVELRDNKLKIDDNNNE